MKKILTIVAVLLLVFPLTVNAALAGEVETITVKENGSEVEFNGTTNENPIYAVMCKLFDSSDKEVDKVSVEVADKKYEGKFTRVANGSYKVSCANYGGGDFKSATVKVTKSNINNPKTGDAILTSVGILAVSTAGLTFLFKKSKKN